MITAEQELMARALAEVVKERELKEKGKTIPRIKYAPSVVNNNEIDTEPIAEALFKVLSELTIPQPNIVSTFDTAPLSEALVKIVESSKTPVHVKVDMTPVAQAIQEATKFKVDMSPVAKAISELSSSMERQGKMIEKLFEVIADLCPPKVKKTTTRVVRDKDGDMKETVTSYEYDE